MLSILIVVTLHLGTIQAVDYEYEGTMEDCITTLQRNILEDIHFNSGDYMYYYYCVPHLVAQDQQV